MTCLSGPQISSHLSRFVFDMTPPEIESFVAKIVATNVPRASHLGQGQVSVGRVLASLGSRSAGVRDVWVGADTGFARVSVGRVGAPPIGLLPTCAPRPKDLSPAVTRAARTSERWRHFF